MTQAFRIIQRVLSVGIICLLWLASVLWPKKALYRDRFATDTEVQSLARDTSFGLLLGLDRHGHLLSAEATPERPHLGHLAIFGPTGAGKTTMQIEQLKRW